MEEAKFLKVIRIDPLSLDKELVSQAQNYWDWGSKWARAKGLADRKKEKVDLVKAELDLEIRDKPEDFGISDRLTEAQVSSAIARSEDYQEAMDVLIDANEDVNLLAVAKTALEHKKKMLEGLWSLYLSGYYAHPKTGPGGEDFATNAAQQEQQRLLRESKSEIVKSKRTLRRKKK